MPSYLNEPRHSDILFTITLSVTLTHHTIRKRGREATRPPPPRLRPGEHHTERKCSPDKRQANRRRSYYLRLSSHLSKCHDRRDSLNEPHCAGILFTTTAAATTSTTYPVRRPRAVFPPTCLRLERYRPSPEPFTAVPPPHSLPLLRRTLRVLCLAPLIPPPTSLSPYPVQLNTFGKTIRLSFIFTPPACKKHGSPFWLLPVSLPSSSDSAPYLACLDVSAGACAGRV